VDDDLHHRVRMAAARERVTIKAFVIAALSQAVERDEADERGRARGQELMARVHRQLSGQVMGVQVDLEESSEPLALPSAARP
jgi:hypothetical protein